MSVGKLRITGGFLRGRLLRAPDDQTIRPTADKTRLAVFNMLESRGCLRDAVVIDAFCGTGALGIEAISRGAVHSIFIDQATTSLDLARANAGDLKITDQCMFMNGDATRLTRRPANILPATLIFLDPPYRQNLVLPAMASLIDQNWVSESGAILVVESEKEWTPSWRNDLQVLTAKTYGQSALYLLQKDER